ncbi:sigma-70 family RNA polymerase sigma factor [Roseburia hominis]
MDEGMILARIKNKEEAALEELLESYGGYITGVASKILLPYMCQEDVQEVVNDTFYSLWIHSENIDLSRGSLKTYLTAIARNRARNKFRESPREVPLREQDTVEVDELFEKMVQKERAAIIGQALRTLKEEEREILIRYYFFYQDTKEIAELLNMRVNTVKSKLRRGRKKLEKQLKERREEL